MANIQGYVEAMRDGLVEPDAPTIDTLLQQVLQLGPGVDGQSAVDRAGLQHGAARRLEEPEALAEGLGRGRSTALVTGADPLDEGQRVAEAGDVEGGEERPHPVGVDVPGGLQQVGSLAVEHDADVDELLTLHARDAAHDDVLVGQQLRHPRLPGARRARPDAR